MEGKGKSVVCSFSTVGSSKLEHGCRMIYAGSPSLFGSGLEDGQLPTPWASFVTVV